MDGLDKARRLKGQFEKGVAYFKGRWNEDQGGTPPVRRQLAQFERDVIALFDREMLQIGPGGRAVIEAEVLL